MTRTPSVLFLSDFDGTLFKSPEPPGWWDRHEWEWWVGQSSLDEPCVPERPGSDWWIGATVRAARAAIAAPDTYTVLATGRADKSFRWRVPELLRQIGLDFDEVHLNPGADTQKFKSDVLGRALDKHPSIERVEMWDDDIGKLAHYVRLVEASGREAVPRPVRVPNHEPLCGPETGPFVTAARRVAARWARAG